MKPSLRLSYILISCIITAILCSGFQSNTPALDTLLEQDTCMAHSWVNEGECLSKKGAFIAAETAFKQANLYYKKHQLWPSLVENHLRLSVLCDNISFESKAKYAEGAFTYAQQYLPIDSELMGKVYQQKAEVAAAFEQFDSSIYYYQIAIPQLIKTQAWENVAWCHIQQAINHYYLGNIVEAKAFLEDAFWQQHPFNPEVLATLYNIQGVIYYQEGDLDQAINITTKALELDLSIVDKTAIDSSYIANHYNNIASFHNLKNDYQRALDYYRNALRYYQQLNNPEELIYNQIAIAKVLLNLKEYEQALEHLKSSEQQIHEHSEPHSENLEELYFQLGVIYRELQLYDSAFIYANKAIALPETSVPFLPLTTIGSLHLLQNQPQQAISILEKAEILSKNAIDVAIHRPRIFYYLGKAHEQLNDYSTALSYYQKALMFNQIDSTAPINIYAHPQLNKTYDKIYFLDALQAKARAFTKLSKQPKDLIASLETYELAIQWTDSLRQDYILEENELFWSQRYKQIYEAAISVCYQLFEHTSDKTYLYNALAYAEKSKAQLLLEAFRAQTSKKLLNVPPDLIQTERDLSINAAFYKKKVAQAREEQDSSQLQLFESYLTDSRMELALLKEKIERDYPQYYQLKYDLKLLDVDDVCQNLLDNHTALLEYFIGEVYAYVFVLTKDQIQLINLPQPALLDKSISNFNQVLLQLHSFQNTPQKAYIHYNKLAHQVYQHTLEEALNNLHSDIDQLIIIPDATLSTLSFEALNDHLVSQSEKNFAQLPYLIKRYQIHYAYSVKLLQENKERSLVLNANNKCLALAPPYKPEQALAQRDVRSNQRRNGVAQLEFTQIEIEAIHRHFDGQFEATSEATKSYFLDQASNYGILHLAMHGEADFEDTQYGHLIFTNLLSDTLEENLLYHYEIANMDLNTQLVVLSACETGVGKYEAGEGVFSLARSFMHAGVPSVIMSLWKVNDQSTSQLMPIFYQGLAKGLGKDEALRLAKLKFLEEANLEYRHPFYWSGFVSLGDPQPIRNPAYNFPWRWGLGLLLIIISGIFLRRFTRS